MSQKKAIFFKILKYIGITLISLLAFMFIAPYIFADKINAEIKKVANQKLNAKLDYSESNVSFFNHFPSLTVSLDNFKLNGSAPYQNENLITAKEIAFGIDVPSLIFGKSVNIDKIFLSNADINVKVNKEGFANYNVYKADKTKTTKKEEDSSLKLEKIEITNSKIVYDDLSTKLHFDIFGFNYIGKGDLSKAIFDLSSKAQIEKLNLLYDNEPYLMNKKVNADLITKVNVNSLSLIFEQNDLKINNLVVDFKGKFDFLKEGYNMDFILKTTNSNLHDFFTAFPPKFITWLEKTKLTGKTDCILSLKGNYIASKNIAPKLELDFKIKDGSINYNQSPATVTNLDVDFDTQLPSLNPDSLIVDLRNLSLNIDKESLKAKLYSTGTNILDINAALNAKIDLEKLNRAIGIPDVELKGMLVADGTSKGKFDKKNGLFPVTNAVINLNNGFLKTKYYPNPITNIGIVSTISNPKGTFEDLKVVLQPAQFTFEGNPVFVKANLSNFDNLVYDVTAKGTLDIGKIYQVFSQKGLDVDGFIKADLALKGKQSDAEKGNYSKLKNSGTLEIRNIKLASEYLPKTFLIKEGIFKFNNDKMRFNTFLASYGQSDFQLNGYLQNVFNFMASKKGVLHGSFSMNSKYINADEFMSNTTTNTTETTTSNNPTAAKTETGVIIVPPNLDLHFTANAQKVNFNGLELKNAKGSLNMKNGLLSMQNTGFDLIGCTVAMNATYKSIDSKNARFEYHIKANEFDIKRAYKEVKLFRDMASAAEKAQGIISLDYNLKGRLNANMEPVFPSLLGNGVISVKNVKMYGMKMFGSVAKKTNKESIKNPELNQVDIKSSIKNNIITVERFKFKFAGFRPRIEGTTSLDGRLNLKMRLGLPPLGILGIPLTITGNKDNPKIKIGRQSEDLEETKDSIQ
ncbi:AsmA-like C-terminal region-containing protein [Flavobacterium sp. GSA192]|uniref:AsmA-like C-terminal region-containing protein n=1 Tax=Flavobacterium sp. GSA192 TaxID=2576304 RepID=UPI0011262FE6|nr:AsmA-like C-terminal region-containing protein [Flavobacterium sp. GSA192]